MSTYVENYSYSYETVVNLILEKYCNLHADTIGRFASGAEHFVIPTTLPAPQLPDFSIKTITSLFPTAISIAVLAAIESLLSAVVADGMIGTKHDSNMELIAQGIANNAYAAALEDNRFSPVTEDELPEITYSISLLTNFEKINYTNEQDVLKQIKAGKDGIVIRDGNRQGVFLPVVWTQLRDKTEFFKQLKIKAGMNPNYWNNGIKVYRFRAVEIKNED